MWQREKLEDMEDEARPRSSSLMVGSCRAAVLFDLARIQSKSTIEWRGREKTESAGGNPNDSFPHTTGATQHHLSVSARILSVVL